MELILSILFNLLLGEAMIETYNYEKKHSTIKNFLKPKNYYPEVPSFYDRKK